MQEIIQTAQAVGQGLLMILGGLVVVLRVTHKYTETEKDDKLYKVLNKVHKVFDKILPKEKVKIEVKTSKK